VVGLSRRAKGRVRRKWGKRRVVGREKQCGSEQRPSPVDAVVVALVLPSFRTTSRFSGSGRGTRDGNEREDG
jgi:hypothetical protein